MVVDAHLDLRVGIGEHRGQQPREGQGPGGGQMQAVGLKPVAVPGAVRTQSSSMARFWWCLTSWRTVTASEPEPPPSSAG